MNTEYFYFAIMEQNKLDHPFWLQKAYQKDSLDLVATKATAGTQAIAAQFQTLTGS